MVSEDISGKDVKNGISVKEYAEINGHRQGMFIESKDASNPVLLFLHGGPGFPAYPMIKKAVETGALFYGLLLGPTRNGHVL